MQARFETFTVRIAQISRSIRKIKTEEMAEFGLKSPHVSCLYYLYKQNDALTAKELCDACDEDKAAVSRSLEYLEANGYLRCESKSVKRYKSPLFLTDKGREIGARIAEKIDGFLNLAGEGLDEGERVVLYKALALISDNLQKICQKYGE